ncbi:MAG: hypothetical protein ABIZ04_05595 [Opitutus sp.]
MIKSREAVSCFLVFLAALATSLTFTHAGWKNTLLDTHPFRQTQTALTAYWMVQDGGKIDYETPVMGAPWSIPIEFPLYQMAVAAVVRTTHCPLEFAGRAVTLFFFYAALPGIWLLLRRLLVPTGQRWLFLALVLLCPVYLFYSRTVLIESTAFCLAIWFLFFFEVAITTGGMAALVGAMLFGIATGLAKVTTLAVFLAPATAFALWTMAQNRADGRKVLLRAISATAPGVIAAALWVFHSDAVKKKNVLGTLLTSSNQHDWNYGPFALRFQPKFWTQFAVQLERAILPAGAVLVFLLIALLFLRGRWRLFATLLLIALAGPLVFTNLYFVHDYYLYGSGVLFLAVLALPLKQLFERTDFPFWTRLGAVVVALIAQFCGYLNTYYQPQITAAPNPPDLALAIARVTQPTDVLLGFGLHWNPVLPYYSGRRAMMVPDEFNRDDVAITKALANLGSRRVAAVILARLTQPGPAFFAPWLKKLSMDENPFLQTGEYTVHLRKDLVPEALKALAGFPLHDLLLYQGQLAKPDEKPPIVFWVDQVADKSMFSMMHPAPVKVTVPFGLGAEQIDGRLSFAAHTPTEVEIPVPSGATHISADFGLNPGAYDKSDGVEFEVILLRPNGWRQKLFNRVIQPSLLAGDRGRQTFTVETAAPMEGSLLFRTLPAGNPNFDWAYWSRIEVR